MKDMDLKRMLLLIFISITLNHCSVKDDKAVDLMYKLNQKRLDTTDSFDSVFYENFWTYKGGKMRDHLEYNDYHRAVLWELSQNNSKYIWYERAIQTDDFCDAVAAALCVASMYFEKHLEHKNTATYCLMNMAFSDGYDFEPLVPSDETAECNIEVFNQITCLSKDKQMVLSHILYQLKSEIDLCDVEVYDLCD